MKQRGFSLVETLVTAALLAVIAGVVMGVMAVAVRASGMYDKARSEEELSARILEEISLATRIVDVDTHLIRFKIADRTGDNLEETIEYFWSGTNGESLMRRVNDSAASVVLSDVSAFGAMVHATRVEESIGRIPFTSTDRVVARNSGPNQESCVVNVGTEIECTVKPAFDPDVVSWRPSTLKMKLASEGARSGRIAVNVFRANASGRTSTPIASTFISENALQSDGALVSVPLQFTADLDTQSSIIIFIGGADQEAASRVWMHQTGVADRNGRLSLRTSDQLAAREYSSGSLVYELSAVVNRTTEAHQEILRGQAIEMVLSSHAREFTSRVPLLGSPAVPDSRFVREDSTLVEDGMLATGGGG